MASANTGYLGHHLAFLSCVAHCLSLIHGTLWSLTQKEEVCEDTEHPFIVTARLSTCFHMCNKLHSEMAEMSLSAEWSLDPYGHVIQFRTDFESPVRSSKHHRCPPFEFGMLSRSSDLAVCAAEFVCNMAHIMRPGAPCLPHFAVVFHLQHLSPVS
jgi:hypothetical protein